MWRRWSANVGLVISGRIDRQTRDRAYFNALTPMLAAA
jgi:hypothetical protein